MAYTIRLTQSELYRHIQASIIQNFAFTQPSPHIYTLIILAGIPVEGKSPECLICMKYRIIILIIIISLGQIFYRILQTHHACTCARAHTHARTRMHTHVYTRAHTQPSRPSPSAAKAITIHRRPVVTASSAGIHRGAPFIAGSMVIEINSMRYPPEFPDNLEVFRV